MERFNTGNGTKDHKSEESGINEINRYLVCMLGAFNTSDGKRGKAVLRLILQGLV